MSQSISRRTFAMRTGATLLAAPALVAAQKPSASTKALSDEFLTRLPTIMEWANVPGLAIATIKDAQLEWARGFGVRKAGARDAVDANTLFGAASLSKPVFAYAVLRMREQKLIDLDRPLWEYLPYADLPAGDNAKLITARHVLSHSSGLQNWRFNRDQQLDIAFKPGERFQYSGEGFYYLQRVVEQISGKGFEEYMQENVLRPLGLVQSTYLWNSELEPKVASGHNPRMVPAEIFNAVQGKRMFPIANEWKKPVAAWKYDDVARAQAIIRKDQPPLPNFLLPNTAGSLVTSAGEYGQFMTRLMARPKTDQFDLSESSRREMLSPQLKINNVFSWGLGIGVETQASGNLFWHWGDNGTFKTFMIGDPARRTGIVVLTNSANGHRLWQRIIAEAIGRDHPALYFWMV